MTGFAEFLAAGRIGSEDSVADLVKLLQHDDEMDVRAIAVDEQRLVRVELDAPTGDATSTAAESIGSEDRSYEVSEEWLSVAPALRDLPERERTILYLRFFEGKTQTEIADELGISQMHVSRLVSQSLEKLRKQTGT